MFALWSRITFVSALSAPGSSGVRIMSARMGTSFLVGSLTGSTSCPPVRLGLHPLREAPHPGMVSQRLHGVVAPLEVGVGYRDVDVAVARAAQGYRPAGVAPPEPLPALSPAPHLPGAGARQEVVAGDNVLPDASPAQLAPAAAALFKVLFAPYHAQIIRGVSKSGSSQCSGEG